MRHKLTISILLVLLLFTSVEAGKSLLIPWAKDKAPNPHGLWEEPIAIPYDVKDITTSIKNNTIYYRDRGRCFMAVLYCTHGGHHNVSVTQVTCGDDIGE